MRNPVEFDAIYLCRSPVDMRMWIDGLAAIVEGQLKLDPFGRYLFAFTNRCRDKIKCLYWDMTGFACWYKRLEREVFTWPDSTDECVSITAQQLSWLLDGYDIRKMKPHEPLKFQAIS